MSHRPTFLVASTLIAALSSAPAALTAAGQTQPHYHLIDLTPNNDSLTSYALGINKFGHVVGYTDENGFIYAHGKLTLLPTFGHQRSVATAINDRDEVIGYVIDYDGTNFTFQGFEISRGAVIWLKPPPDLDSESADTVPLSLNDRGVIVGYSMPNTINGPGTAVAVKWTDGVPEDITDQFATQGVGTIAYAVNDAGKIAAGFGPEPDVTSVLLQPHRPPVYIDQGVPTTPNAINVDGDVVGAVWMPERAFVWSKGRFTMLPDPSFPIIQSYAEGINKWDRIVGIFVTDGGTAAAMWHDGEGVDLNSLTDKGADQVLYNATGINIRGQVCGAMFADSTLITHAFLITPTDAPDRDRD